MDTANAELDGRSAADAAGEYYDTAKSLIPWLIPASHGVVYTGESLVNSSHIAAEKGS